MPDLNVRERTRVNTPEGHRNTIRIWAGDVEGCYAADSAEGVLRCVGSKGVGGDEPLRVSQQLEFARRDNEVGVASHGAVGAIAVPSDNTSWCIDCPSDSPTVASSMVGNSLWAHHVCNV